MRYLCLQYHTDPVPGLQKPLVEGALRYLECRLSLVADVIRRNEHVCAMFEHLGREALGETIFRFVEVAKHCVALTPSHQGIFYDSILEMRISMDPMSSRKFALTPELVKPMLGSAAKTMALMAVMINIY